MTTFFISYLILVNIVSANHKTHMAALTENWTNGNARIFVLHQSESTLSM